MAFCTFNIVVDGYHEDAFVNHAIDLAGNGRVINGIDDERLYLVFDFLQGC